MSKIGEVVKIREEPAPIVVTKIEKPERAIEIKPKVAVSVKA